MISNNNNNNNNNKAIKLFAEIDEDSSGQLDKNEFHNLIDSLGLEITDEAFEEYDINQGYNNSNNN